MPHKYLMKNSLGGKYWPSQPKHIFFIELFDKKTKKKLLSGQYLAKDESHALVAAKRDFKRVYYPGKQPKDPKLYTRKPARYFGAEAKVKNITSKSKYIGRG